MKKKFTDSDFEEEKKNYKTKFYNDQDDDNSLYNELKELRETLQKEFSDGSIQGNSIHGFYEEETETAIKNMGGDFQEEHQKSIPKEELKYLNPGGFLENKLKILKDEIEDINSNIHGRERIGEEFSGILDAEIKELFRQLYNLPTWQRGSKEHLAFVKLELFKQICSLKREKRLCKLNLWKDNVFEKKDRRNLIFEYKSLKAMDEPEQVTE